MSAPDQRDMEDGSTAEPDSGLGATADPMAFGAALAGLGKRLAIAAHAPRGLDGEARGWARRGRRRCRHPYARLVDRWPGLDRRARRALLRPRMGIEPRLLWAAPVLPALGADDARARCRCQRRTTSSDGKAEFAVGQIVDALAPTNFLLGNPAAMKRAFETGGASVTRGFTRFVDDVVTNGGWPRQVDTSALELGKDLAATPGKVVYRNRLMELIQFAPRTETVFETPLLLSPPWINKYYVMDLAPGKSFAEWAVDQGHTVFCISYRNPDESFRDIGLEDYLRDGPLEALDVIQEITGAKQVNMRALCLGATLTAVMLAHLARSEGRSRACPLGDAPQRARRLLRARGRSGTSSTRPPSPGSNSAWRSAATSPRKRWPVRSTSCGRTTSSGVTSRRTG